MSPHRPNLHLSIPSTGVLRSLFSPHSPNHPKLNITPPIGENKTLELLSKKDLESIGKFSQKMFKTFLSESTGETQFKSIPKSQFPDYKLQLMLTRERVWVFVKLPRNEGERSFGGLNYVDSNYLQIIYSTNKNAPKISKDIVRRHPIISDQYIEDPQAYILKLTTESNIHKKISGKQGICPLIAFATYVGHHKIDGTKQPIAKHVQYLQYFDGDLSDDCFNRVFSRRSSFSTKERISFAYSVGKSLMVGLKEMHDLGIVHLDVKLENLLKKVHDEVVLADFGHATDAPGPTTMGGTILYFSPELFDQVFRGEAVLNERNAPKSDVWAAGVTLYYLLFGVFPLPSLLLEFLYSLNSIDQIIQTEPKSRSRNTSRDTSQFQDYFNQIEQESDPYIRALAQTNPSTPSSSKISLEVNDPYTPGPFSPRSTESISTPTTTTAPSSSLLDTIIEEEPEPDDDNPQVRPVSRLRRDITFYDLLESQLSLNSIMSADSEQLIKDITALIEVVNSFTDQIQDLKNLNLGDIWKYISRPKHALTEHKKITEITNTMNALQKEIKEGENPKTNHEGLLIRILTNLQEHASSSTTEIKLAQKKLKEALEHAKKETQLLLRILWNEMDQAQIPKNSNRIYKILQAMLKTKHHDRIDASTALTLFKQTIKHYEQKVKIVDPTQVS